MAADLNGCDACGLWCCRCWRCGGPTHWLHPYYLCEPCTGRVRREDIAWMGEASREPGKASWEMTPMFSRVGRGR